MSAAAMKAWTAGVGGVCLAACAGAVEIRFTGGSAADFQSLLDKSPTGAVIVCEQAGPLEVAATIQIQKPVTVRGFKACLPPKRGRTPILIVEAPDVTLTGFELRGNYDSVSQENRAPLIHVKRGGFRIERCTFRDGSKDGIMVAPDDGVGDIVGGIIRDIEGHRMARDLVSLSGGNGGLRIRDVTVENVRLKEGFLRGAVEISDGADNITVRNVMAEDAVYALDVQDHGPTNGTTGTACAPNTRVVIEDVTATRCKHILRTANHAQIGHAGLTLRNFTGWDCAQPVRISNTTRVLVEHLTVINEKVPGTPAIALRNSHNVLIRDVTVQSPGGRAVEAAGCTAVTLERVACNGAPVEQPADGANEKRNAK
jgi:hypothetical protein